MLKRMFKQLDPAVMNTTTEVQGEIKIALKLLADKSLLLVKVTCFAYKHNQIV